jgi:hypothetical protein
MQERRTPNATGQLGLPRAGALQTNHRQVEKYATNAAFRNLDWTPRHERKNIRHHSRCNLRGRCIAASVADCDGLVDNHRDVDGAYVVQLDRSRGRRCLELLWNAPCQA